VLITSTYFWRFSVSVVDQSKIAVGARAVLIRDAFRIEYITIAWMVIEAAVAIESAIEADSLTLLAFGIDSLIELASASILVGASLSSFGTGRRSPRARNEGRLGSAEP
jgi:hypothetical protein